MHSPSRSFTNRLISTVTCAISVMVSSCIPSFANEPGDFNNCLSQGRAAEQAGKNVEALVYYGAALRLNPNSPEARQRQSSLYHKVTSGNQLASSSGDYQDQQSIRAMVDNFVTNWNNHDLNGLRRLIANDYLSADGLTYEQIMQLAQQTWQMYPSAKNYFEVKNLRVNGNYAEAETVARIVGTMRPTMGVSGNMRSTVHDLFGFRKTPQGWKVTTQVIVEESVNIVFGNVTNISAHITVPNTMAPGQTYTATVDALLPAGATATVGLAQSTPQWPIVEPPYTYVQLAGPSLSRQFTANMYGRNEDVGAKINISNGYTGQAVGMIWLSKRVNIVDSTNMIASAGQSNVSANQSQNSLLNSNNASKSNNASSASDNSQASNIASAAKTSVIGSIKAPRTTPAKNEASVSPDEVNANKSSAKADRPIRDKWAIIVGISNFEDPKIPKLQYSAKDAVDFYKFLEKTGNFKRDHMRLLLNEKATQRRILTELATLFLHRVAEPDDLVVVFFSTHGSPTEEGPGGNNYLVAYDTSIDELFATGVSMQAIMSTLRDRINSDRILLVLDACHSGATTVGAKGMTRAANFDAEALAQGSGQLVICSSEPAERSWESKRAPNGVFTKKLMEGLTKNGSQTRLADAFSYLQTQVQKEVKEDRGQAQKPVLKSKWNGADLLPLIAPADPQTVPNSLKEQLPPDSSSEVK